MKNKLIKLLGGYTEEELSEKSLENVYKKKINYIFSEIKVSDSFYNLEYQKNERARNSIKGELAREIGIELLRNNLLYFYVEEDTEVTSLIKATLTTAWKI